MSTRTLLGALCVLCGMVLLVAWVVVEAGSW